MLHRHLPALPNQGLSPALQALRDTLWSLRQDHAQHAKFDPARLQAALVRWLSSGEVALCEWQDSVDRISLTVVHSVRLCRDKASGVITLEWNAHWEAVNAPPTGDFDRDFADLVTLRLPRWAPMPEDGPWCPLSPRMAVPLGKQRGLADLVKRLLQRLIARILQLVHNRRDGLNLPPSLGHRVLRISDAVVAELTRPPVRLLALLDRLRRRLGQQLLDPEVRKLFHAYRLGPEGSFQLYDHLARHRAAAGQRWREASALARLAYHLPRVEGDPLAPDRLAHVKAALKQNGLSEQGWRWLSKQSADVHDLVFVEEQTAFLALANWCAEFKLQPPLPLLDRLLDARVFEDFWHPVPPPPGTPPERGEPGVTVDDRAWHSHLRYLFRAVAMEAARKQQQGQLPPFLQRDLACLFDWLHAVPWAERLRFPTKRLSYAWLDRQQQHWHQRVLEQKAFTQTRWPCLFEGNLPLSPEVVAVPLTDSLALYQEGQHQRHCVASYVERCAAGLSRIYSLRTPAGATLATLELVLRGPYGGIETGRWSAQHAAEQWTLGQVQGPCNQPVAPALRSLAERFAEHYQQQWAALPSEQRWTPRWGNRG